MKKTMGIEGMGCVHCEAKVKAALEAVPGVTEAVVSRETKSAVITLDREVSEDVLMNAVKALNKYSVTGMA